MRYHLNLKRRGAGDTFVASGLIRDLHRSNPDIRISVTGNSPDEALLGLPGYLPGGNFDDTPELLIDYKPTRLRARTDPAARYFYSAQDAFEAVTGVAVDRGRPRPEIVLTDVERTRPYPYPYAVVAAGSKVDIPVKQFPLRLFRDVIDRTRTMNWKQIGLVHDGRFAHRQTALDGAENMLGRTSLRKLIRLIAHADVVLCHVSLPLVIASALNVPCVVLAGGRETASLFRDAGLEYLDTIGRLPCCETAGCYRAAALTGVKPGNYPEQWLCVDPVDVPGDRPVGRCTTLIGVRDVLDALDRARSVKRVPLPVTIP